MNSILLNQQLFNILLESILTAPGGKRSLSRLARTCKPLCEPTLKVLWRELDNLIPMLSLFPAHLLRRAKRPGMGFAAGKALVESDWASVVLYGNYVQKVAYDEHSAAVSSNVFPVLEEASPVRFIFPALSSLTWKATTTDGLRRALLFVPPSLQRLTLDTSAKLTGIFLEELNHRSQLTALSITSYGVLPDSLPDDLSSQMALQEVVMMAPGALSAGLGKWIATRPALVKLQLDLSNKTTSSIAAFFGAEESRPQKGLPDIESLHLTGEIPIITVFLSHVRGSLQSLTLAVDDNADELEWRALLLVLHNRFGTSLCSVVISATRTSLYNNLIRNTGRNRATTQRRLPLHHFGFMPKLSYLDIDLPESTVIHDADVLSLAQACPSLEHVRLCPTTQFPQEPPSLTLEGLASLVRDCQRLRVIYAAFNALPGSDAVLPSREVFSRSLSQLHVGHSWPGDPLQTSILLSQLAPRLESLRWFHERNRPGYVEKNALAWQTIASYLPHLQAMRVLECRQSVSVDLKANGGLAVDDGSCETCDQEVDATVETSDQGVSATPGLLSVAVQAAAPTEHRGVHVHPSQISRGVHAIPPTNDQSVDSTPQYHDRSVETSLSVASAVEIVPGSSNLLDAESAGSDETAVAPVVDPASITQSLNPNVKWAPYCLPFFVVMQFSDLWSVTATDASRVYTGRLPTHLFGIIQQYIV